MAWKSSVEDLIPSIVANSCPTYVYMCYAWASAECQGGRALWIFIHDPANVFFNKYSLCENIPTILVLCCTGWRQDAGMIEDKWGRFFEENGLKFSKVGILPKMGISPKNKKSSLFMRGSWCSVPLRRALGACLMRPLTPLTK